MKEKKCKQCKKPFMPVRPLQTLCNEFDCAVAYAQAQKAKRLIAVAKSQRAEHRAAVEKSRGLKFYLDTLQTLVNRYVVKVRDKNEPCISCGTRKPNIQYAAGHFRTRGAASQLRFNLDNLHKQCNKHCNMMLSGNIIKYRPNIIAKIGQERFDTLMCNNEESNYTIEWAVEQIALYRKLLKENKVT